MYLQHFFSHFYDQEYKINIAASIFLISFFFFYIFFSKMYTKVVVYGSILHRTSVCLGFNYTLNCVINIRLTPSHNV